MTGPTQYCDCPCHKSPDLKWNPVGVPMLDTVATESACSQCVDDHRFAAIAPTEMEFPPDSSTAWNDDQGDGTNGRNNAP